MTSEQFSKPLTAAEALGECGVTGHEVEAIINDLGLVGWEIRPCALDVPRDYVHVLEAYAQMESQKHKPEQGGGCACGFCVYSIEHVVTMSIRDAWPLAQRDWQLGNNPVVQDLVARDRAGTLTYTEVPGDREIMADVCPVHHEPWVTPDTPDGFRRCTFYVPELGANEDYGCSRNGEDE